MSSFYQTTMLVLTFTMLMAAAYYDSDSFRIPNRITFTAMGIGLVATLFVSPLICLQRLAAICVLFFFGMFGLMGMGDLKLCMGLVALCGWLDALYIVVIACVLMILWCLIENPYRAISEIKSAFFCILVRTQPSGMGKKYPFSVFLFVGFMCLMFARWAL